jgi:hypothetical protein
MSLMIRGGGEFSYNPEPKPRLPSAKAAIVLAIAWAVTALVVLLVIALRRLA